MLNTSDKNVIREDIILIMEDPPLFKSYLANMPHHLPMHRIVVTIKGTAHITVNFIDYTLQEGDLIVIPANYIVQYNHQSPDFSVRALAFNFNTEEENLLMPTDTIKASTDNRDLNIFDNYFSLLQRLLHEEANNKLEITSLVIALLHRVQTVISYYHTLRQPSCNSATKKLCSAFIKLVMQQANPNQPVSFYADQLCTSANYLDTVVKTHTNRTPRQWIAQRVFAHICQLLLSPDNIPIKEIAYQTGYSSPTQLIRFFKQHASGHSPSKFRKLYQHQTIRLQLSERDC